MTPQVSGFITGLLEDTDKNIEVADTSRHGGEKRTSTNTNVRQ